MIRGGNLKLAVLGALEVSEKGDLANWIIPDVMVKGMGGAMDLVAGAPRVIVLTDHVDKKGRPKLKKYCTLPLTGTQVVDRVITDLAVFDITEREGMVLRELAPGVTLEQVEEATEAAFTVIDTDDTATETEGEQA